MALDTNRLSRLTADQIALLGVPWDIHSSFLRGAALAPPQIRLALHSPSANLDSERGLDLAADRRWEDLGDLSIPSTDTAALELIRSSAAAVLERGARLLSLGGDHAVTLPLLRAYGRAYPNLTVLQLDAHSDLYDEYEGDRYSHACPFARAYEEGLIGRLVQVGVRAITAHQREQARRFGVEVVEMRDWQPGRIPDLQGPLYVTLDMDVLDPAFAPGISHHEPGGMSTREVLTIIQQLPVAPVGADIVELNPVRDHQNMTAMTAAKFLRELLDRMLSQ